MNTASSMLYRGNISSSLSSNYEADASKSLDNLKEMFPRSL